MRSSIYFYVLIILVLTVGNIYQVIVNYTLKQQSNNSIDRVDSEINTKIDQVVLDRYFYFEEYYLQGYKIENDLYFTDFRGESYSFSDVLIDGRLILYFNEISCSSCNIEKVNKFLKLFNDFNTDSFAVITNFEDIREFQNMVVETGINKYPTFNSSLAFDGLNIDSIVLFYFFEGKIHYPFVISEENFNNLPFYASFIDQLK